MMFSFSSTVMAAAFNVPAVIFHYPLKLPAKKGTVVLHFLRSKEAIPLLPDPLLQHTEIWHAL